MNESGIVFNHEHNRLVGILHQVADCPVDVGVLIIVGGPQTRVGSHRQFVLLSRALAKAGIPSMRFDYSGMGDADGEFADFLNVSEDIALAVEQCKLSLGVSRVVIWGLCDAASSALIFAKKKSSESVAAMILLNPWVRSEQGEAKAIVKHYYLNRLKDKAFWKKVFSLQFDVMGSLKSLFSNLGKMFGTSDPKTEGHGHPETTEDNYISHMLDGLHRFNGKVMMIISGDDLTAAEFMDLAKSSKQWKQAMESQVSEVHHMPDANHTFSTQHWRAEVEKTTEKWVKELT